MAVVVCCFVVALLRLFSGGSRWWALGRLMVHRRLIDHQRSTAIECGMKARRKRRENDGKKDMRTEAGQRNK